jgi:phospholipid transport system substrate-binding protein
MPLTERSSMLARPARSRAPLVFILAMPLLLQPASARGAESPIQVLQHTNEKVVKLLEKKTKPGSAEEKRVKSEAKKLINTLLDYGELGKRALAKNWGKRTEKERIEFVGLLRDLIERNYVKQLKSNLGYKIEYKKETIEGDEAKVETVVKVEKKGKVSEIAIEYVMRKAPTGWMVYDVVTDEVSIVKNYRSQFNRIIKRESYEALVKKMRKKIDETESDSGAATKL